ncbi:MAG: alpha/beta fold hydrolase [Acidimicrobiia bacterium]
MQHATGAEGNRIAYEVEGDGPDLILMHGITENRTAWGATRQRLARLGRVIAVDLRGHGDSDPADTYALDAMAADVKAVADEVGAGLPTLVGHSLGGFVASVYAAAYPTRTVVNIDQPLSLAAFKEGLTQVEPMLRSEAFPGVIGMMFDGMMAPLPEAERQRLTALRRPVQEVVLGVWDPIFTHSLEDLDTMVRALVGGIDAPYLAIHGDDPGDEYRTWLTSLIPHAEVEVWPGNAHYPHLNETERFVNRVAGFVN